MKKISFLLLFIAQVGFGQSAVSEILNKIEPKGDTIKSIYDWVTGNIRYDVIRLNLIVDGAEFKTPDIVTLAEYKDQRLKKVIKERRGVCGDYAMLFNALAKEFGYECYMVSGYVREQGKEEIGKIGHAWNAVKVNGQWKLYDPTMGAGFINFRKKFVKNYDLKWYDVDPKEMIKTHMPFDPIWQLSNQPLTYEEFNSNSEAEESEEDFPFQEIINEFSKKPLKTQLQDKLDRSDELGEGPRFVELERAFIKKEIGLYGIKGQEYLLKEARTNRIYALELYKEFLIAKKNQLKGEPWSTETAKDNLLEAMEQIETAIEIFKEIEVEDEKLKRQLNDTIEKSINLSARLKKAYESLQ